MSIKHTVSLEHLTPQAVLAACIVATVMSKHGYDFVLTSGADSKHVPGSLHPKGRAFDFRTRNILDSRKEGVFTDVREALGPEFDVIVEKDHCHVEWDPMYLKGKAGGG